MLFDLPPLSEGRPPVTLPPEDDALPPGAGGAIGEIELLEAEFPEWNFAARWTMAGSGPDGRLLLAWRGDVTLSAPDADGLRRKIRGAVR